MGTSLEYWPSKRWKIAICAAGHEHWFEPSLPFALIGSHPCCSGRVDELRIPPVAYIACCFEDSVEIWPTSPIAYPRWGVVEPEHPIIVGKQRIHVVHESHRTWDGVATKGRVPDDRVFNVVGTADTVDRKITFDWDGTPRSKTLGRRVMILGDDHPSTIRLHELGLHRCDHAVVSFGGSVWLINLQPAPTISNESQLVSRLHSTGAPVTLGQVSVRLGRAVPKKKTIPAPPLNKTSEAATDEAITGLAGRELSKESDPSVASKLRRHEPRKKSVDSLQSRHDYVTDEDLATPEALTSNVTDRLVTIDQEKFSRRRILVMSASLIGFCIALATIVWIFITFVLPMIALDESEPDPLQDSQPANSALGPRLDTQTSPSTTTPNTTTP